MGQSDCVSWVSERTVTPQSQLYSAKESTTLMEVSLRTAAASKQTQRTAPCLHISLTQQEVGAGNHLTNSRSRLKPRLPASQRWAIMLPVSLLSALIALSPGVGHGWPPRAEGGERSINNSPAGPSAFCLPRPELSIHKRICWSECLCVPQPGACVSKVALCAAAPHLRWR